MFSLSEKIQITYQTKNNLLNYYTIYVCSYFDTVPGEITTHDITSELIILHFPV